MVGQSSERNRMSKIVSIDPLAVAFENYEQKIWGEFRRNSENNNWNGILRGKCWKFWIFPKISALNHYLMNEISWPRWDNKSNWVAMLGNFEKTRYFLPFRKIANKIVKYSPGNIKIDKICVPGKLFSYYLHIPKPPLPKMSLADGRKNKDSKLNKTEGYFFFWRVHLTTLR